MNAAELIALIEKKVPPFYSLPGDEPQRFGSCEKFQAEIHKAAVMLDYYPGIEIPEDTDFLVLHHPPKSGLPPVPTYVLHSGWDTVSGGAGDALADLLGLIDRHLLDTATHIGRIGKLPGNGIPLDCFAEFTADKLNRPYLHIVSGRSDQMINTVAAVSGFGLNPVIIKQAKQKGADVLVSGDLTHPGAVTALNSGIALIDATHYATEMPGIYRLRNLIASFGVETEVAESCVPWRTKTYHDNY